METTPKPELASRAVSGAIFLIGGLWFGFYTFQLLMLAVWGAPTSPVQYVALSGCLLLVVAAGLGLFAPAAGRWLALAAVLGIGVLYIPGAASLVSQAGLLIGPINAVLVSTYFALLAYTLFHPARFRWSTVVFCGCLLTSVGCVAATYAGRAARGELRNPLLVAFQWKPGPEALRVEHDPFHSLPRETVAVVSAAGVKGTLSWCGSSGRETEDRKVVVICSGRIPADKDLPHPKHGTVVYLFDGTAWRSIPAQPEVFPAHATLETDGMLAQDGAASSAYNWPQDQRSP